MEETNTENGGVRRLVLGFDAGCMTCSELARTIEERVGDRLEVRSLNDPQVEHWREKSLGENAPWAPTLIETEGANTQAWTGVRMGIALGRRLGPAATWRIVQALGDLPETTRTARTAVDAPTSGISRRGFLRGVSGTAVALGMLTGTGNLASVAFAQSSSQVKSFEALKSVKATELGGRELIEAAQRAAQRKDIVNLMGRVWSDKVRSGKEVPSFEDGERAIQLQEEGQLSDRTKQRAGRIAVKAVRHELKNGAAMLAVAYKLPEEGKVLVYYESDRPIPDGAGEEFRSRSALYKVEHEEAKFEGLSIDGGHELADAGNATSARIYCGGCDGRNCAHAGRYCASIKWGCLTVACVSCIPSCGSLLGCLYCAIVQCPYAYFVACCRRTGYRCVKCRYCR